MFRDSHSSFRSSLSNLAPVRSPSALRQNNLLLETLEDTIKKMNLKISVLVERINKMEDERKKWLGDGLLSKTDKENKSTSVNPIEMIRRDIKKVNEEVVKTN